MTVTVADIMTTDLVKFVPDQTIQHAIRILLDERISGAPVVDEAGKLVELDVKAGDRVLFGKWSGTEVKIGGADQRAFRYEVERPNSLTQEQLDSWRDYICG